MVSRAISDLHPDLQLLAEKFLIQCRNEGINSFLTCTYRSNEEQDIAYAQGRTTPGHIITNAQAGQSPHNCVNDKDTPAAQAFDFAIRNISGEGLDWDAEDPQWKRAIQIGEELGLVSGSRFKSIKDNPHFQLKDWKTS